MHSSLFPYAPDRDAYRLLGIPSTASSDEVNVACRRLARTFHPDRNGSRRATDEMAVVNAVRRVLIDPDARAAYDYERRGFHERRARAMVERVEPTLLSPYRPPRAEHVARHDRYVARVAAGMGAALAALLPPRCAGCRAVILAPTDAFCAGCGTPLLGSG